MIINATHWSDLLTSPAAICAVFLLLLFFVGELMTFFATTVPRRAPTWLQPRRLMIVGRPQVAWSTYRAPLLEPADRLSPVDEPDSWVTLATGMSTSEPTAAANEAPNGPGAEQLRAFTRWLVQRGRLDEWSSEDESGRRPASA